MKTKGFVVFLEIHDLSANISGKQILDNLCFEMDRGQVHAIMGQNGSGKSTLANVVMGHPKYTVSSGKILVGLDPGGKSKEGSFRRCSIPYGDSRSWLESFFEERLQYFE